MNNTDAILWLFQDVYVTPYKKAQNLPLHVLIMSVCAQEVYKQCFNLLSADLFRYEKLNEYKIE